jgi:hypothetical protein
MESFLTFSHYNRQLASVSDNPLQMEDYFGFTNRSIVTIHLTSDCLNDRVMDQILKHYNNLKGSQYTNNPNQELKYQIWVKNSFQNSLTYLQSAQDFSQGNKVHNLSLNLGHSAEIEVIDPKKTVKTFNQLNTTWLECAAKAFDTTSQELIGWYKPLDNAIDQKFLSKVYYYLYLMDQQPAATSMLIIPNDQGKNTSTQCFGVLQGSATLPEFRKKGLYSKMIELRINEAKSLNLKELRTNAIESTSFPILKKFGFEVAFSYQIYYRLSI